MAANQHRKGARHGQTLAHAARKLRGKRIGEIGRYLPSARATSAPAFRRFTNLQAESRIFRNGFPGKKAEILQNQSRVQTRPATRTPSTNAAPS